jgi:hypothetical protein
MWAEYGKTVIRFAKHYFLPGQTSPGQRLLSKSRAASGYERKKICPYLPRCCPSNGVRASVFPATKLMKLIAHHLAPLVPMLTIVSLRGRSRAGQAAATAS